MGSEFSTPGKSTLIASPDDHSIEKQGLRLFAEGVVSPRTSILPSPRLRLVPERPEPTFVAPPLPPTAATAVVNAPPGGTAAASVVTIPHTRVACELEIIAALDQGEEPGERIADAFRRKEHVLGNLFASLSVDDARRLHQRLTNPTPDDPIAVRMKRFTPDRSRRLITFLADARRRAAVAKAR